MRRILRSSEFNIIFSFIAVFIATIFSGAFLHDTLLIPLLTPAVGVSFGLLLIHGRKLYPAIISSFFLGHLLLHLVFNSAESTFAFVSAIGFSLILITEMELGLRLINKVGGFLELESIRMKTTFRFFFVASVMSLFGAIIASIIYYVFQDNVLSFIDMILTIFISHFLSIGMFGLLISLNKNITEKDYTLKKTAWAFLFIIVFMLAILYINRDSSSFVFYRHNYMLVVFYIVAAAIFSFLTILFMTLLLFTISVYVYFDSSWVLADFYAEVYTLLLLGLISILLAFIINWYLEDEQKAGNTLKKTNDSLNLTLEYIQNLLQLSKNIGHFTTDSAVFAKKTYDLSKSVFNDASAHFAYFDTAGYLKTLYSNHYSLKNIPAFYELHDAILFDSNDVVVFKDFKATLIEKYGSTFMNKHARFSNIQTRVYLVIRIKDKKHLIIGLDYFKHRASLKNHTITRMKELTRLLNQLFMKNHIIEQQSELKDDIILTLVRTLDLYDKYTKGHGEAVARICKTLAIEMELPKKDVDDVYWAGLLHDIGKLGVDHAILNSENRLSDAEYKEVKNHVDYGYQLINESYPLKNIARIMREHHERLDGKGYPLGLDDDSITMGGRILSVADAIATMASNRPYQVRKDFSAIIEELNAHKGTQFDPEVADACIRLIKEGSLDPSE